MVQGPVVLRAAVLPTIGLPDQVIGLIGPPPRMDELSQIVTTLEAHQAGQAQILATAPQADLVMEEAMMLQVEVQVDPQAAQEDPGEGGINPPFFLVEIIRKSEKLRYNFNHPI